MRHPVELTVVSSVLIELLDDCRNCTSAYCVTTLTDSELKTLLHSDRSDEVCFDCYVVTRHAHVCSLRKLDNACNVCCSEVELRTITSYEGLMTATLFLCKNVNLACELCVRSCCAGLSDNLTSFNFLTVDTTEEAADVVTSLSLIH